MTIKEQVIVLEALLDMQNAGLNGKGFFKSLYGLSEKKKKRKKSKANTKLMEDNMNEYEIMDKGNNNVWEPITEASVIEITEGSGYYKKGTVLLMLANYQMVETCFSIIRKASKIRWKSEKFVT
jgi:hypothetical protein